MVDGNVEIQNSSVNTTEEIPKEQALKNELSIFQEIVSNAEITRDTLLEAWNSYRLFTSLRAEINDGRMSPESAKLCAHAAKVRYEIMCGNSMVIDRMKPYYEALFFGDTIGTRQIGGYLGVLLRGLESDKLDHAIKFVKIMNRFGFASNDLEEVLVGNPK